MNRTIRVGTALAMLLAATGAASAQPIITSLGSSAPSSVSNLTAGSYYVGGGSRWIITGSSVVVSPVSGRVSADGAFVSGSLVNSPQVMANTATAVSPAFSLTPTLVPTAIAATETGAGRWSASSSTWTNLGGLPIDPSLLVFGSGSSGGSSGSFLSPNTMSPNGRFIAGQGYISTYNTATGTAISMSNFMWRPYIWDSAANAGAGGMKVLPTPFRTSSNTYRRRTGAAFAVSNDGLVVAGYQEHSSSVSPAADPDGARPVVWRWDSGTNAYVMTFLPNGVNGSGFPYTASAAVGTMHMNAAGTIIVGRALDNAGNSFIGKWIWNAGTSSWDSPLNLGSNLTTPASWLPFSVTSCAVPPTLQVNGMTEDGNTLIGTATYSTCGSFMAGGWIWTSSSGVIRDWYDYLVSQNVAGITANFGPIGDNGDPTRGLAKLGFPSGISPDGSAIVGFQGGNQLIPGAAPWILNNSGGSACVAPQITTNPTANITFTKCTASIILNGNALGTLPLTYQWYRDGVPLADGTSAGGGTITGANSFQMRVNTPGLLDAGTYSCTITGCNMTTATTTAAVVAPGAVATNDSCANAAPLLGALPVVQNMDICSAWSGSDFAPACAQDYTQLWYTFAPPVSGEYRFSACSASSTFNSMITVYDDCGGNIVACNIGQSVSSICSNANSAVVDRVGLIHGLTYRIRVAARGTSAPFNSAGVLTVSSAPALVANDSCANATAAVVGTTANNPFDTANATTDGSASCGGNANGMSGRDIWFHFTPPATADYRLTTCGGATGTSNAPFNTVLTVFEGCNGSEVACNDDQGSGVPNLCTGTTTSRIDRMTLTGGVQYLIRIAGTAGAANTSIAGGAGNLTLSVVTPPANDNCSNATVISTAGAAPYTVANITNADASKDGESGCTATSGASDRDLWYAFTPATTPADGWRIQLCGNSWDSVISVHTGCPGNESNQIACNDNVGSTAPSGCGTSASRIDRVLLATGTTYYIRLAGATPTARGAGATLTISNAPPAPVNDLCVNATAAPLGATAFDLLEATTDDATLACVDANSTNTASNRDVWFSFVPACSGRYTFQTCGSTITDPMLHLFSACGAASLTCSDNVGTTAGCTTNQAKIANVSLPGGIPVLVRVAVSGVNRPASSGSAGTLTIVRDGDLVCRADFDGNGSVVVTDIFKFLTAWFAGSPCANFNGTGGTDVGDIFAYLTAWFTGCP